MHETSLAEVVRMLEEQPAAEQQLCSAVRDAAALGWGETLEEELRATDQRLAELRGRYRRLERHRRQLMARLRG